MEIEKLQSLSDEILDELLIVWEKSVRSSHHFLKVENQKGKVRRRYRILQTFNKKPIFPGCQTVCNTQ